MKTQFYTIELLFFLSLDVSYEHSEVFPTIFFFIPVNSTFLRGVLFHQVFISRGSYFRGSKTLHIFARTQFFALLYFSLGSYFRVSKMVLIFAGPKNRENKNTRSLKPRNGEPCEIFDVYSKLVVLMVQCICFLFKVEARLKHSHKNQYDVVFSTRKMYKLDHLVSPIVGLRNDHSM